MTINTLPATFEGANIDIIIIGNERWVRVAQIGTALGYGDSGRAIRKIYDRRKVEFSPNDTLVVELPSPGGAQLTRLFSETGIAKLAMFADTPKAAAFRDWAAHALTNREPIADTAALADEVAKLTAQRDALGRELLAFKPALKQVLRYLQMGHGHAEVALLMRWKTEVQVRRSRRQLEAMGLIAPPANLAARQAAARRQLPVGNNPHALAGRKIAGLTHHAR